MQTCLERYVVLMYELCATISFAATKLPFYLEVIQTIKQFKTMSILFLANLLSHFLPKKTIKEVLRRSHN